MELILFYIFAVILIFASTMVVIVRNPVFAVLFLVLAFFTSSVLWIMLEAEFLAITLVLVYVGAVMVLFLFVVMMLDINLAPLKEGFIKYLPVGVLVGFIIAVEIILVVGPGNFGLDKVADPVGHAADYSNTKELGRVLYTKYMYPFEIAAVILLVAIIAAISLTLRKGRQTKYIKPEDQVSVRKEDRIRIVKMKSGE
ncbi:MAG: NADH-quinone oxidoreductase subunit J [Gammaproteobacteria bacterium]|nr:NADH-quinone oxidoreductase subunit J [Gammaproteobacteria bacterium]